MNKYKFICEPTCALFRRAVIEAATPEEALAKARQADRSQWETIPPNDHDAIYDADYSLALTHMQCLTTGRQLRIHEKE